MKNLNIVWMGDMNNVLFSLMEILKFTDNTKIDVFTDKKIFLQNKEIFNLKKFPYFSVREFFLCITFFKIFYFHH